MFTKDYYSILNITQNASEKEIKKAYRVMAKKFHPDSTKAGAGSADIFSEINEAYKILSDPDKKKEFDAYLPKSEPPPSHKNGLHSPPKTHYHPRSAASTGRFSGNNDRIWKERNASIRYRNKPFPKPFKNYQRGRKISFYMGVFLGLIAVVFVLWTLFPFSGDHRKRKKGYVQGGQAGGADVSSPYIPGKQETVKQIRDEIYRELIVQPEIKKRLLQSLQNQLKNNSDTSLNPVENGMQPESDRKEGLAEEIWREIH
jgi:curved DNA-binding protein CbpA